MYTAFYNVSESNFFNIDSLFPPVELGAELKITCFSTQRVPVKIMEVNES